MEESSITKNTAYNGQSFEHVTESLVCIRPTIRCRMALP